MKTKLLVIVFLSICTYACSDNNTEKETEELENVDALIKQDSQKADSLKKALDSLYNQ